MSWSGDEIVLVDIDWLKPHEQVKPKKVEELKKMTIRWKGYTKPILVDSVTGSVLDGHHRYNVGLELNLKRLPALLVDYLQDENISVTVWPNNELVEISKQDVIAKSLSDEVYPPKTSKHILTKDVPPIFVTLAELSLSGDE
jgi:hypothetical protein